MDSGSTLPLDELYREMVLDHSRRPRGRDPLVRVDASARGFNPVCGDEVEVRVAVEAETVAGVQVAGRGCAICTASGSILAEVLPGRRLDEATSTIEAFRCLMHGRALATGVDLGDLEALSGVARFPVRVKCAMLPWVTLEDALDAWRTGAPVTVAATEREVARS
jgi:nitrogen fixation protein NifU and related proteins